MTNSSQPKRGETRQAVSIRCAKYHTRVFFFICTCTPLLSHFVRLIKSRHWLTQAGWKKGIFVRLFNDSREWKRPSNRTSESPGRWKRGQRVRRNPCTRRGRRFIKGSTELWIGRPASILGQTQRGMHTSTCPGKTRTRAQEDELFKKANTLDGMEWKKKENKEENTEGGVPLCV